MARDRLVRVTKGTLVRVPPTTVTLVEKIDSREWTESDGHVTIIRRYICDGTDQEIFVRSKLELDTPIIYSGLVRAAIDFDAVVVDEATHSGRWNCTVKYKTLDTVGTPINQSSYAFDITGGTERITQSIQNVGNYAPPGKIAPNHKGAINANKDRIEGAEVFARSYNFNETHILPNVLITNEYKGILFHLKASMNDKFFKGFDRGECAFIGATGARRGQGDWEINFKFSASPNRNNFTIGEILITEKLGWDFLWVKYSSKVDSGSNTLVQIPASAHVERVLDFGNFDNLLIGSA